MFWCSCSRVPEKPSLVEERKLANSQVQRIASMEQEQQIAALVHASNSGTLALCTPEAGAMQLSALEEQIYIAAEEPLSM